MVFLGMQNKKSYQKRNAGKYYGYNVNIDENDPNDYNFALTDPEELLMHQRVLII